MVDFGLAQGNSQTEVKQSLAAGTFCFMAPEQIYNCPLSKATDLYALGVTLLCLLTGIESGEVGNLVN